MSTSTADQKQVIEQKITEEKNKLKERISKLIKKENDTAKLIALIDEEKAKSAKKVEQLKNQKQGISNKEKSENRKKRTRRLIQHGALAEKYFNCGDIDTEQFEILLKNVVRQVENIKVIEKYFDNTAITPQQLEKALKDLKQE
jgi:hypothetical protein